MTGSSSFSYFYYVKLYGRTNFFLCLNCKKKNDTQNIFFQLVPKSLIKLSIFSNADAYFYENNVAI